MQKKRKDGASRSTSPVPSRVRAFSTSWLENTNSILFQDTRQSLRFRNAEFPTWRQKRQNLPTEMTSMLFCVYSCRLLLQQTVRRRNNLGHVSGAISCGGHFVPKFYAAKMFLRCGRQAPDAVSVATIWSGEDERKRRLGGRSGTTWRKGKVMDGMDLKRNGRKKMGWRLLEWVARVNGRAGGKKVACGSNAQEKEPMREKGWWEESTRSKWRELVASGDDVRKRQHGRCMAARN